MPATAEEYFGRKIEVLLYAGNVLARALGHYPTCPKVSPTVPCTCGEGAKQAQALADWTAAIEDVWND